MSLVTRWFQYQDSIRKPFLKRPHCRNPLQTLIGAGRLASVVPLRGTPGTEPKVPSRRSSSKREGRSPSRTPPVQILPSQKRIGAPGFEPGTSWSRTKRWHFLRCVSWCFLLSAVTRWFQYQDSIRKPLPHVELTSWFSF